MNTHEPQRLKTIGDPTVKQPTQFESSEIIDATIPQPMTMEKPKFDFPTEIIDLPSKGLLYPAGSPLSSGKVEIKYMTAKEEDILSTQSYIANGIVMDKICEAIIVTPGVNYDDLLLGDKNAVFIGARIYGYGPMYETAISKPDGTEIPVTVDLMKIEHKTIDESLITQGVNKFKFQLPHSKNNIEFKLLTVGDQKKIDADLKGMKKYSGVGTESNLTTRLRFMILSVDGNESQSSIAQCVNNMIAMDSRAFRDYVQKIQPDIDLNINMEDPATGETFRAPFKIGINILYPDFKE